MNKRKKLPIGIESFEEMRKEDFYYVDKTRWIEQLLAQWGKVNLFTRPRRFGKSLNMSMLQTFFEVGADASLFDGLYISKNKEVCKQYLGKFPVVSISLKGVNGNTFDEARSCLVKVINREARRLQNLSESEKLTQVDKELFEKLLSQMKDDGTLSSSLLELSELLEKHYEEKVIVLIDEYDVPLAKANENGYYDEMVLLIRNLFENVLKTNHSLKFAVLTGCLRVAKESIFTGLNNFKVYSITDVDFDENFGFTDDEVSELLETYHLEEHQAETKEWYDGYHIGGADVYCPWDVINHVDRLRGEPGAQPQSYWINTSGNDLVKRFVNRADKTTRDEMERLIAGESVEKEIRLELTYDEIDQSIDNLWSVLFTTGYLTRIGKPVNGIYRLAIPNREVREVYITQIQEWFKEKIRKETGSMQTFCKAFLERDSDGIQKQLTRILNNMISILDTKARNEEKEIFYHGLLLGLLRSESDWLILSNAESGDGFSDILIEPEDPDMGIVIELKYAPDFSGLENACKKAMQQIKDRRYADRLKNDGRSDILAYGIAFCKKRCRVIAEQL